MEGPGAQHLAVLGPNTSSTDSHPLVCCETEQQSLVRTKSDNEIIRYLAPCRGLACYAFLLTCPKKGGAQIASCPGALSEGQGRTQSCGGAERRRRECPGPVLATKARLEGSIRVQSGKKQTT